MAEREKLNVRLLGAILLVALVLLLIARFVIHNEPSEREELAASSSAVTLSPVPSASAETKSHARYESALVDARIDGISSGAGTAIAVGDEGIILHYDLEHPTWRAEVSPTHAALHAVAQQLDEAIAVGDDGTIIERDTEKWTLAAPVTKRALRAVVYTSYGAFAVGDGGTILKRFVRGEPWRVESSGTTHDLFGACAGLRDVWVVGDAGTILLHGLDAWKLQPSIGTAAFYAVACDDHAAIAVGAHGAMIERLDDVGWHDSPSGTSADLFAVAAPFGTKSFVAVGANGTVVHVTGSASQESQSVDWTFRAVTEGAMGTWLAGDHGIVRRAPK